MLERANSYKRWVLTSLRAAGVSEVSELPDGERKLLHTVRGMFADDGLIEAMDALALQIVERGLSRDEVRSIVKRELGRELTYEARMTLLEMTSAESVAEELRAQDQP